MRAMFLKRKQDFRAQCLKYLRYVLNDHFVLFLMVFLGFTAVQYSQLLRNFPTNPTPVIIILTLISLVLLWMGNVATYLEKPDSLFLLVKEEELNIYVKSQIRNSFFLWGILQTAVLLLLAPVFLALDLAPWAFVLYCILLFCIKGFVFQWKTQRFFAGENLNWQGLIAAEEGRRQRILQFFALFTNVKGISSSVKRRSYLDGLTGLVKQGQERTWDHLFLRSYMRNGDLFVLSLRLLALALLTILFLPQSLIAAVFVVLFNYLLLFQLVALYEAYDYQYLTKLFPLEISDKLRGARRIITAVGSCVLFLEMIAALLFFQEKIMAALLLVLTLLLYALYLPYKLKSLVD